MEASNTTKATKLGGKLHNLIGGPKNDHEARQHQGQASRTATKPQRCLGFQEPKSNKLAIIHLLILRAELKPMQPMQWKEHTKWSSPSHSNPSTTTKAMEKYERKNKELTKNSKIKIQGVPLT